MNKDYAIIIVDFFLEKGIESFSYCGELDLNLSKEMILRGFQVFKEEPTLTLGSGSFRDNTESGAGQRYNRFWGGRGCGSSLGEGGYRGSCYLGFRNTFSKDVEGQGNGEGEGGGCGDSVFPGNGKGDSQPYSFVRRVTFPLFHLREPPPIPLSRVYGINFQYESRKG